MHDHFFRRLKPTVDRRRFGIKLGWLVVKTGITHIMCSQNKDDNDYGRNFNEETETSIYFSCFCMVKDMYGCILYGCRYS